MPDTRSFALSAVINQLLSVIIHTFYTNKEIFLLDLIRNSFDVIRKNLVKKFVELCFNIAENHEAYTKFCEAFSKNLILGIHEDPQNRSTFGALLSYHSTKSGDAITVLKDYAT